MKDLSNLKNLSNQKRFYSTNSKAKKVYNNADLEKEQIIWLLRKDNKDKSLSLAERTSICGTRRGFICSKILLIKKGMLVLPLI